MHPDSMRFHIPAKTLLPVIFMFLAVFSVSAQTTRAIPVNIFGDGNPENGIEDSRQQLMSGQGRGVSLSAVDGRIGKL